MNKLLLAAVWAFMPAMLQADTVGNATELLSQWEPRTVSLTNEGVLRVVLNEPRISDTIFYSVIQGFCFAPLLQTSVEGVTSVFVLNRMETQGWLFEQGVDACSDINDAPANRARLIIAGSSSVHTNSATGL